MILWGNIDDENIDFIIAMISCIIISRYVYRMAPEDGVIPEPFIRVYGVAISESGIKVELYFLYTWLVVPGGYHETDFPKYNGLP